MRVILNTAAFTMYFKSSSFFLFPVWRRQIIQLHFKESTFRFSFHSAVTWQMCNVLNRLRFEGDTEAKLGASVGCRGDGGCTTPTVTSQRACWVNMDSPESGTTGNDTTEEKTTDLGAKHTHTNMNDHTQGSHRGEGCFSCQHLSLPPSPFSHFYLYLSLWTPVSLSVLQYSPLFSQNWATEHNPIPAVHTLMRVYTHPHTGTRREAMLISSTNRSRLALRVCVRALGWHRGSVLLTN